jgi:hypothetical protein
MKNKFSWKAFISFGLTYSFIIIIISGIMLYASPPGRYAHWVNWTILGFSKESWQAIHTVFSYTFVILSVFHLFTINWKTFLSYLKTKTKKGMNKQWEFYLSTILTIVFFFGIVFSIPPFKSVMDLGEHLTASWEETEEVAPISHAELLTLNELAVQMNLSSVDKITEKLKNNRIKFDNVHAQTLKGIAEVNNSTPQAIYEQINQNNLSLRQGSGIGRKTIEDFAIEAGTTPKEAFKILKENNIKAEKGQTLKTIGENNDIPPRDIFELFSE